jgi:GTPase SAR1 family protein
MGCCQAAAGIDPLIPISVLGLTAVGKTTIVEVLSGEYSPRDPPFQTCGVLRRQIEIHDRSFLIYDVCGYLGHVDEWLHCVEKSVGVIIVHAPAVLTHASGQVISMYEKIGPAIAERKIPTLTLINRCDEEFDVSLIDKWNSQFLAGAPTRLAKIVHLRPDVMREFEWLEMLILSV